MLDDAPKDTGPGLLRTGHVQGLNFTYSLKRSIYSFFFIFKADFDDNDYSDVFSMVVSEIISKREERR